MLNFIIYNIIFLPIISSIIVGLYGNLLGKKYSIHISIIGIILTMLCCLITFYNVGLNYQILDITLYSWIKLEYIDLKFGLLIDSLTATMLIIITIISCLVHIYSTEYMQEDPHIIRFMSYLSLFIFFMIILVTANNILQMFFGWEGVGLSSYLLINFWYTRIQANKIVMKQKFKFILVNFWRLLQSLKNSLKEFIISNQLNKNLIKIFPIFNLQKDIELFNYFFIFYFIIIFYFLYFFYNRILKLYYKKFILSIYNDFQEYKKLNISYKYIFLLIIYKNIDIYQDTNLNNRLELTEDKKKLKLNYYYYHYLHLLYFIDINNITKNNVLDLDIKNNNIQYVLNYINNKLSFNLISKEELILLLLKLVTFIKERDIYNNEILIKNLKKNTENNLLQSSYIFRLGFYREYDLPTKLIELNEILINYNNYSNQKLLNVILNNLELCLLFECFELTQILNIKINTDSQNFRSLLFKLTFVKTENITINTVAYTKKDVEFFIQNPDVMLNVYNIKLIDIFNKFSILDLYYDIKFLFYLRKNINITNIFISNDLKQKSLIIFLIFFIITYFYSIILFILLLLFWKYNLNIININDITENFFLFVKFKLNKKGFRNFLTDEHGNILDNFDDNDVQIENKSTISTISKEKIAQEDYDVLNTGLRANCNRISKIVDNRHPGATPVSQQTHGSPVLKFSTIHQELTLKGTINSDNERGFWLKESAAQSIIPSATSEYIAQYEVSKITKLERGLSDMDDMVFSRQTTNYDFTLKKHGLTRRPGVEKCEQHGDGSRTFTLEGTKANGDKVQIIHEETPKLIGGCFDPNLILEADTKYRDAEKILNARITRKDGETHNIKANGFTYSRARGLAWIGLVTSATRYVSNLPELPLSSATSVGDVEAIAEGEILITPGLREKFEQIVGNIRLQNRLKENLTLRQAIHIAAHDLKDANINYERVQKMTNLEDPRHIRYFFAKNIVMTALSFDTTIARNEHIIPANEREFSFSKDATSINDTKTSRKILTTIITESTSRQPLKGWIPIASTSVGFLDQCKTSICKEFHNVRPVARRFFK